MNDIVLYISWDSRQVHPLILKIKMILLFKQTEITREDWNYEGRRLKVDFLSKEWHLGISSHKCSESIGDSLEPAKKYLRRICRKTSLKYKFQIFWNFYCSLWPSWSYRRTLYHTWKWSRKLSVKKVRMIFGTDDQNYQT